MIASDGSRSSIMTKTTTIKTNHTTNFLPWKWLLGLLVVNLMACQPPWKGYYPTAKEETVDSMAVEHGLDSTVIDIAPAYYREIYAPNTPYETPILVYEVDLDSAEIQLINGQYTPLKEVYQQENKDFKMLVNAGMFHPGGNPVGLFLQDSIQLQTLNEDEGRGNFFLQPNGVFYITANQQAGVLETSVFRDSIYNKETPLQLATQSGPILLMNGEYHPKFRQASPNKYIRNGVGVTDDQRIIFILSEAVVNLHTFASIFLEKGCKNALYLDGAISGMYIPAMNMNLQEFTTPYGPILGVLSKPDSLANVLPSPDTISSFPNQPDTSHHD